MKEDRVFVLTGPVHVGKTTFLLRFLQGVRNEGKHVNGILSLAIWEDSIRKGYDAFDLASGESYPLLRTEPDPSWPRAGRFGMLPEGLRRALSAITRMSRSDLTVIDEMGPLELSGRGFWPGFQAVRERLQPALVVVRQELVPGFQKVVDAQTRLFQYGEAGLAEEMRSQLLT